ncbi:glycosyl transferase [Nitrospira sp. KM1]|uniref:glycosyltransferase family A protein n=1 Tax=Nitrospira sp. KM1 TaxID=1936990 RepID=UPI0013A755FD|nr:glycosyltransferase family A protein [Nitrospira sp. KM1]BCA54126.1 glycosyl transferase [Nitrospira sp. KM1]
MNKKVTIAIPVYKRLDYLVDALQSVASQDYDNIEVIVSDNGENGTAVKALADKYYPRPYRFRQNPQTVPLPVHYNQLIAESTGDYFAFLDYDDMLSPNYVSDLVGILERHPEVAVALARVEVVDAAGKFLRTSSDRIPEFMSGPDFIRSWNAYGFESYSTVLGRADFIKADGGHPPIPGGTHTDDVILIKLCLRGSVAISQRSSFRWRYSPVSFGWSLKCASLAEDTRVYLKFLDSDPSIARFAAQHPMEWSSLKPILARLGWQTYLERWEGMYRAQAPLFQWIKGGFALPYIPEYYRGVGSALWYGIRERIIRMLKRVWSPSKVY